ncbi:MAG: Ig-like domain-containing protein [Agathobacter sp.]|nr:Ig-like domain-containing protein [Agathobacter sp.]
MKYVKRIVSLLLMFVMVCSLLAPIGEVQAATKKKVAINKTTLTMIKGDKYQLKVSNVKTSKVKWSTSNKKIVTVDKKGKVTAKKKGTATVTAKVGKKSYKCKITVIYKPVINKTKVSIYNGYTYQLKLSNAKASEIKWSTSNKKIAKVDKNGKVTGVKKGTATITAKVANKSFKCKVTVKSVALNKKEAILHIGKTTTLKLNKGKIKSVKTNNEKVATVTTDGKVTAVGYGQTTITITSEKNKNYTCKVKVLVEGTPATTITAYTAEKECNSDKETYVYIHAILDGAVEDVGIYDKDGNFLLALLDDGKYASSGDDLIGDGIYSVRYFTSWLKEGKNTLYVKANVNGKVLSSKLEVNNVTSLATSDVSNLVTVNERLKNDIFFYGFVDFSFDKRKEIADNALKQLEQEGLIKGLYYDAGTKTYTFLYKSGVVGMALIGDIDPEGYETNSGTGAETAMKNVLHIGNALMLNAFQEYSYQMNQFWRDPFYEELETEWESKGLDTGSIGTSVDAYKNIGNYDLILISGHGACGTFKEGTLGKNKTTLSSFLLTENATRNKSSFYCADLKERRVGIVSNANGSFYALFPKFFEHYYGPDGLEGKFIFAENCSVFGNNGTVYNGMADAFLSAGAECFVGFHNDVMARYSRDFMKVYVDNLISGKTAQQAFDAAVNTRGANDYFAGRETYGPTAYPILRGNKTATLFKAKAFTNGDFETAKDFEAWKHSGDARIIKQLGEFTAPSKNKMAVLTTGIASAAHSTKYGNSDNGMISQLITIPAGTKKLCFTYNMISEEPMDFVGTQYNDMFFVTLSNGSLSKELFYADLVNSTWYEIKSIDFDGGDDTVFQTKWRTVEIDVSAFAGTTAELIFAVDDVVNVVYNMKAESAFPVVESEESFTFSSDYVTDYGTAVLLDNIYFK